jgi:hypothetical protein
MSAIELDGRSLSIAKGQTSKVGVVRVGGYHRASSAENAGHAAARRAKHRGSNVAERIHA